MEHLAQEASVKRFRWGYFDCCFVQGYLFGLSRISLAIEEAPEIEALHTSAILVFLD
jgi:hypothetical protein